MPNKVEKELNESLLAVKRFIKQLPLNAEQEVGSDWVLLDLISQNLRTDYKIYIMGFVNDNAKNAKETIETLTFCSLFRSIIGEYLAIKASESKMKSNHSLTNMLQDLRAEVPNDASISKRSLPKAVVEEKNSTKTPRPKDEVNNVAEFGQMSSINSISSRNKGGNISWSRVLDDSLLQSNGQATAVKRNVAEMKRSIHMFKTVGTAKVFPANDEEQHKKLLGIIKINQNSKHSLSIKTDHKQMQTSRAEESIKLQENLKLDLISKSLARSRAKGNSYRSVEQNSSDAKQCNSLRSAGTQLALQSMSTVKSSFQQVLSNTVEHVGSCFSCTKVLTRKIHNLPNPPATIKYIFLPMEDFRETKEVQGSGKKLRLSRATLKTLSTTQKASNEAVRSYNLLPPKQPSDNP
eukprot:TRINITY_DN9834_c0_g3_i1.p1 TRINITY_DN9834_c0_g3~~TRINITY_DN9834_c0_g3_i1.p1  ORF type:complete len:407 (-),score=63.12 TRINITY_DN9834_c0_g3_i1:71-1291(-)